MFRELELELEITFLRTKFLKNVCRHVVRDPADHLAQLSSSVMECTEGRELCHDSLVLLV